MSDSSKNPLSELILIGKLDAAVAGIKAERRKIESDLASKEAALQKTRRDLEARAKVLKEKRVRQQSEERALRDESARLVDRRKALNTLGSYKLQQAAAKEIEMAGKQIGVREEAMLKEMEDLERLTKDHSSISEAIAGQEDELTKLRADAKETIAALDAREAEKLSERNALAPKINPRFMSTYERIKDKFPTDAIVPVKNGSCGGCFIQVGPQPMVEISRGTDVVRCRGCGRILFIEEPSSQS